MVIISLQKVLPALKYQNHYNPELLNLYPTVLLMLIKVQVW